MANATSFQSSADMTFCRRCNSSSFKNRVRFTSGKNFTPLTGLRLIHPSFMASMRTCRRKEKCRLMVASLHPLPV